MKWYWIFMKILSLPHGYTKTQLIAWTSTTPNFGLNRWKSATTAQKDYSGLNSTWISPLSPLCSGGIWKQNSTSREVNLDKSKPRWIEQLFVSPSCSTYRGSTVWPHKKVCNVFLKSHSFVKTRGWHAHNPSCVNILGIFR